MVAVAFATQRVLVLPAAFDAQRWLLAWQMLDVASLTDREWLNLSFVFLGTKKYKNI